MKRAFNQLIGGPSDEQFPPWACPYCGSEEGQPKVVYWREWQGDEAHGGLVEWSREACTRCQPEES